MNKNERIARYGKEKHTQHLEQSRQWKEANPEKVDENNHNKNRKGGRYYEKMLKGETGGLRGARNKIRGNHRHKWHEYKRIVAPDSELHHEWISGTSNYNGVALVEKEQHQHGIIDAIQILDGSITLFSEEEIREQ